MILISDHYQWCSRIILKTNDQNFSRQEPLGLCACFPTQPLSRLIIHICVANHGDTDDDDGDGDGGYNDNDGDGDGDVLLSGGLVATQPQVWLDVRKEGFRPLVTKVISF